MKKFTYDNFHHIELPTCILSNIYHNHIGVINNIDDSTFQVKFNMNSQQEVSFDVYKEVDGRVCEVWDKLIPLRYVYIPDHHEYYKADITIDEDDTTVKHITLSSASEYELSNKIIRSLEINTEADILRNEYNTSIPTYVPNVLYNPSDPSNSILDRALADKAPDWHIDHVDSTIANIQRTFSVNNQKIYDFFVKTLSTEYDCLFQFDSVNRGISVYDLMNQCNDCGKRGEFVGTCPKCRSTNIHYGYGRDTNIFINYNNFSESISLDHDEDAVKNCFYVTGGDDLINTAIRKCNPNGSGYVYHFSDADLEDMPPALVQGLADYEAKYKELLEPYQTIAGEWYDAVNEFWYYQTSMMPRTNSSGDKWEAEKGYNVGERAYVRTLPTWAYMECSVAGTSGNKEPDCTSVTNGDKIKDGSVVWIIHKHILDLPNAQQVLDQITEELSSPDNTIYFLTNIPSVGVVNNEIENIASLNINNLFRVEVIEDSHNVVTGDNVWRGNVKVWNTGVEDDKATSTTPLVAYVAKCDENNIKTYEKYMQDKVQKRINKSDNTFTSIWKIESDDDFKEQLKLYAADSLKYFVKSYEGCLETLSSSGINDPDYAIDGISVYNEIYKPLSDRLGWVNAEYAIRLEKVNEIEKKRNSLESAMNDIQAQLNLGNFLGENLYKTLFNYIREDSYQNSNYVSTGLSNGEQINYGKKLLELANEELEKASKIQVTLNDSVKNLLNTEEFKNFKDDFEIGDYIVCEVDGTLYKLRIIGVSYSYSNPDSLDLTFSNYTEISNYFSDAKSIIDSAKSISLSYNSVVHQVEQNKKTSAYIGSLPTRGVGGNGTSISSNTMEEVVVENNGILARQYNDVTQTFNPQQMRIGANQIAFTDDNWKTTKVGIGKQKYTKFDTQTWTHEEKEGYGVIAEFMDSGYIHGSQIVSGDIFSENYKPGSGLGSHLSLNMGEFDFAGGGLVGIWHEDTKEYEINLKGNVNIAGNLVAGTTIGAWTVYEDGLKSGDYMITPNRIDVHEYYQDGKPFSGGGGAGDANLRQMLWEDYENVPEAEKMDKDTLFLIPNMESDPMTVSYVPMTREEYSDLPDSKNTDGVMRLIEDEHLFYVNGITYGDAGGGSDVTITPTLSAGTKIADFSIGGVEGALYAPAGGAGGVSDVLVDDQSVVTEGVAHIDLSSKQDILTFDSAPTMSSSNPVTSDGIYRALLLKQNTLDAGSNITIVNNTISAIDTTYSPFTGATSQVSGSSGLVPAPLNSDYDKFLRGDGTWAYPSGGGGSTVSITPTLSSGTKIADYTIDGVSGSLYAPSGSSGTVKQLENYYDSRPSSANMTTSNGLNYFLATSSMTTGKPPADSHVLHMGWDNSANYGAQFAITHGSNPRMWIRAQNNGTWGNWFRVPMQAGSGAMTAGRVVTTNQDSRLVESSVTSTELEYLSGVTSAIQTQINSKSTVIANPSGTATSELTSLSIDGTVYSITASGGGAIDDVTVDGTSVVTNRVAEIDLSGKQDVLTAGTNITITNNVISATDTTYSDFVGATSSTDGSNGLVPQPLVADKDKFLKGDGTWGTPSGSGGGVLYGTTVPSPSLGEDGSQYAQYNATNSTVSYMYFKINGVWMPYQPDESADAFVDIDNEPFVTEDGDTILFVE